jgi:hypothetical protein
MERFAVSSSKIASVGFNIDTLEVEYVSGAIYQYTPVERSVYDDVLACIDRRDDATSLVYDATCGAGLVSCLIKEGI